MKKIAKVKEQTEDEGDVDEDTGDGDTSSGGFDEE